MSPALALRPIFEKGPAHPFDMLRISWIRGAFFLISVALSNVRAFLHASMQNARPLDKSLYITSFQGRLRAWEAWAP